MTWASSFSIRAKLVAMVMFTTLVALLLAGGALAVFELRSHRRTLESELTTAAQIVAQSLPTALLLERTDTAGQALRALDSYRDFASACLYNGKGALFAETARRGPPGCPAHPQPEVAGFVGDRLILYQPVLDREKQRVGTLRVVADMGELQRRIELFAVALLVVLTGSALVALLLSSALQRVVAKPILELARTAEQISRSHDYGLRAPQHSHDEVGTAVEAFNHMLDRISAAVSERKRAEAQLLALNATLEERVAERTAAAENKAAELKRSNEELERFASVASHDLQEPLRAVASYTQLLRHELNDSERVELNQYLDHVAAGVGRMKALITDLLNYARVGHGLVRTMVDSERVLEVVLGDLAALIEETGASIVAVRPLPQVFTNPSQLGQLFANLISNAIRFRGEAPPAISITADRQGDFWRFGVRDNGIGIEPRHHERIFIIFQRLHARDRAGTGIGLAICRKIAELNGGRIWVDSELGRGATFYFTLPAAPDVAATP